MPRSMIGCAAMFGLLALGGRAADDPEPPGGAAELKRLQGTWVATRMSFGVNESKLPPGMNFLFEGNKVTRTSLPKKGEFKGGRKLTYKVKIDTSKKPWRVTMTPDAGGKEQRWIYKIENDQLYLATSRAGDFPPDFKGKEVALLVLKKEGKGNDRK